MLLRSAPLSLVLLLVLSACSSSAVESGSSSPGSGEGFDVTAWDPDDPVLVYWMDGGECSSPCAFRIEVFTDGNVEFLAYNNVRFSEQIDADQLLGDIASTSSGQLIIGSKDCGREVDGNAPTLQVANLAIDTCVDEVDPGNAIVQTAGTLRSRVQQQVPLLRYDVLDQLRATATAEAIDTTSPTPWPNAIAPSQCTQLYAENPNDSSFTVALAVEASDETCNVWIYQRDNDPYLCPLPRAWPGEVIVQGDIFRCPGS